MFQKRLAAAAIAAIAAATPFAQQPPNPNAAATAEDHQNMMEQLGITRLRPGPSGNESAPNHANYDEALANPYPDLPDPLTLKNGKKVTSAEQWWKQRRPEIVQDFDREVLGRVPKNVPKVTWRVNRTANFEVGGRPVLGKELIGAVDSSSYPEITVEIQMTLVTPVNVTKPVPVMMMFGFRSGMPPAPGAPPPSARGFGPPPGIAPPPGPQDPPATEQLIADGWGYATILPGSIQADNGAGLTKGIIGLVNKGQRRHPDDWGALRAWAWGASRGLDYLETDTGVDAKKVGIEGVSRYGKAALITMAYDERFAVVLVGSSGEGGAKLHRRNFGEAVENLTGSGEYHWMAGNFLKYGAEESKFGRKTAADIPVDAHELIALCAPRPTFISYGVPERGDAKWLDHQGSYMAAVAAQPVFRLLGAKGLGVSDDYKKEKMPPVNVGLLQGQLAWRQHDGGHTDGPNWKYFIPWADRQLKHANSERADLPAPRIDQNSKTAHEQLLEKKTKGKIDVYFEGDSIARRWGALDYPEFLANWKQNFFGWNAADFGWGADKTENILWRLEHGELDGVNPKAIVLLAGTNNVGALPRDDEQIANIARGVKAILEVCRRKAPDATIIVTAIFPRNDNIAVMPTIDRINKTIAGYADGKRVRFLNINDRLADAKGVLVPGVMNERDKLHPTVKGYQIWADGLKPILRELLGPPAFTDQAPPPTGDPSATQKGTAPEPRAAAQATTDAAAVARGELLYTTLNCAACHGAAGRGGPSNAPDLTTSAIAMANDGGKTLGAFLRTGRPDKGMPASPLTDAQAADLSAKLRSFASPTPAAQETPRGRGGRGNLHPEWPLALTGQQLSIVVGDAALGKKFFNGPVGRCSTCHAVKDGERSTASNLAHVATKYPDPKTLQTNMLLNRDNGWAPWKGRDVTAVITYANGKVVRGYLTSVSDFKVVIRDEQEHETEIACNDGEPTVALVDRLQHHLDLLEKYHDDDIHNLTAYLVTLK
jgi:(4-O-methyl)-D-glucuronate---lignin esterase